MKYRYLGKSGLAVSTIGLGTATFGQKGWGCDASEANKILNFYENNGGNFIDTADQYGQGESETIIGKWLSEKKRDNWVIASKCFFPTNENINSKGLSRKHIISACEESLMRLNTEYIDLYQIHNQDPQTPIEETLSALDNLVNQGKIRYIGLSNFPSWKITKIKYLNLLNRYEKFVSGQFLYNLLKRDIEDEIIPACIDSGMGVLAWSPLSGGMLSGKYFSQANPPAGSRFDKRKDVVKDRFKTWEESSYKIVEKVIQISHRISIAPSVVSLSWLLRKPEISSLLVGAKKLEHLEANIESSDWIIADDDWNELEKISRKQIGYPNDIYNKTTKDWFNTIK